MLKRFVVVVVCMLALRLTIPGSQTFDQLVSFLKENLAILKADGADMILLEASLAQFTSPEQSPPIWAHFLKVFLFHTFNEATFS